ncbi:Hypothetical protein NTJ_09799 [Nesidiocoris tenuis]|uniref:OTU domain-containing protein n=1 Tax=Nesidiocoris tenuis TaxID=355587 RepID=A0ABN7AXS7_9HEMI|nr:Hypothetical protein NTJ_09799 [Nesidiocoris tenuis]
MIADITGSFEEAFDEKRRSSKRILKRSLGSDRSLGGGKVFKPSAPSMDSDDDDLVIVSCTDNIKWFYPIDSNWQREMCAKFGLKLKKELDFQCPHAIPALDPLEIHDIAGDGNCYFRCLSYLMTGRDTCYRVLRQKLVNFMKSNEKLVEGLGGPNYLARSGMWVDGTWPTEVEIYASACMLDTDIYTYVDDKWLMFSSKGKLTITDTIQRSIYLCNHENVHYDIVKSVRRARLPRVYSPAPKLISRPLVNTSVKKPDLPVTIDVENAALSEINVIDFPVASID